MTTMRHILAFLLSLLVTSNLSAQTEHVKFLGIPLDGTIQQFQNELTDMGCSDGKVFLQLEGMKAFKGSYAGHDALLMVFYDKTIDVVYQAKAVISCQGVDNCESVFNEINEQLQTEYGTFLSTKSIQFEHDSYGYTILSPQRVVMGVVGLFVTKEENSPNGYSVQVQYTDTANLRVHERQQSDDN